MEKIDTIEEIAELAKGSPINPHVGPGDVRPGGKPGFCFYCNEALDQPHKPECVAMKRQVKIGVTFEIVVERPWAWNASDIEFSANESSSCADNLLDDVTHFASTVSCLCDFTSTRYVGEAGLIDTPTEPLTSDSGSSQPDPLQAS